MSFINLSEQQTMIRATAAEFATKELASRLGAVIKENKYPRDILEKAGNLNLTGIIIPEEFGGMGMGMLEYAIVLEQVAKVSAAFANSLVPNAFVSHSLTSFGTDAQKKKYLGDLASGKIMAAFAVTEANGGSNWFLSNTMTAKLNGDNYILNGSKTFISNAADADILVVLARTNPDKGPMGFSGFIIDKNAEGFSVGVLEDKIGLHGYSTGELVFDNCKIPISNRIGNEGDGINLFMVSGNLHCIGIGAINIGITAAAYDEALKYVKAKIFTPDKTISCLENVQVAIGEMLAEYESAKLLLYKAADDADHGSTMLPVAACMNASRKAQFVTSKAFELHGASGCSNEYNISRYFLDAKTLSVQLTYDQMMAIMGKAELGIE